MSPGASDPESFDDETVRIHRAEVKDAAAAPAAPAPASERGALDEPGALDESTQVSARRAESAPVFDTDDLDATVLSTGGEKRSPATADVAGADPAGPGPLRAPVDGDEPEPDDGSTMVVRRETRRRAARDLAQADEPAGDDPRLASMRAADVPAPVRRIAKAPEPSAATYRARAPHVAHVERTEPDAHAPQDYVDTAALAASARARRRVGVIIGVVLAVCAVAAAVAGIIALAAAG